MIGTEHSAWQRVWLGSRCGILVRVCTICGRVELYISEENHWYPIFPESWRKNI